MVIGHLVFFHDAIIRMCCSSLWISLTLLYVIFRANSMWEHNILSIVELFLNN